MRDGLVRPVVLVLLVCLALPASSQQIWPLDVTLNGDWVDDVAIGTVTVINPTKGSIQVAKVVFNVSFFDSSNAQQGVARDDFVLLECGTTQLPATLAQGEEVVCPFTTNNTNHGGAIGITATVMGTNSPGVDEEYALGMDVVDKLMPAGSNDDSSSGNTASISAYIASRNSGNAARNAGTNTASNSASARGNTAVPGFIAMANANIPGNDVACGQPDWQGKPAAFCRICGGAGAVYAACNKLQECVAFDMEGSDCGYLKASKGPFNTPAPGFTSFLRV